MKYHSTCVVLMCAAPIYVLPSSSPSYSASKAAVSCNCQPRHTPAHRIGRLAALAAPLASRCAADVPCGHRLLGRAFGLCCASTQQNNVDERERARARGHRIARARAPCRFHYFPQHLKKSMHPQTSGDGTASPHHGYHEGAMPTQTPFGPCPL